MYGSDGITSYRGMSESDWRRLHTRVIPNPLPLDEFKDVVLTGKLQDRYLAKDLHKMMQELRDLLREHGELREAAIFPLSGKKLELSRAAAAAVRIIDAHRDGVPALRRSPGSTAALLEPADGRDGSTSPTLDSSSDQQRLSHSGRDSAEPAAASLLPPALSTSSASSRRASRVLPLVDHIASEEQSLVASSTARDGVSPAAAGRAREPAMPRGDGAERSPKDYAGSPSRHASSWTTNVHLSSTIAQHASSTVVPQTRTGATAPTAAAAPPSAPSVPAPTAGPSTALSTGAANELANLNEAAPPFFRILSVVRRFQFRFGSSPLRFEIPVQYTEAVNNRRLRLFLIPLRHPNIPARWPTAKEIVVYVNEQCVMTPWKRSWPDRKQEVAKTFLPLDVTYLLSRNIPSQRMQVDVFNKEYLSPAILAVVQPQTLEEVTESMLLSRLGCRTVAQVRQALQLVAQPSQGNGSLSASPPPSLLLANNAAVRATYAQILDEDEEEDGLEVDDPVITTKCPISQMPLSVPVRGRHCTHLQCVDLEAFLVSSHKGAYWNCALCDAEMRPKDVQIDTVLWSFLVGCGSPEAYPTYLRLSARPAVSASQGRHYWHPSTRTGEDADVVSDSDESNGSDADTREEEVEHQLTAGDRGSPPPPTTSTQQQQQVRHAEAAAFTREAMGQRTPTSSEGSWESETTATTTTDRKRGREEADDGTGEPQGTADDPIEL